MAVRLDGKPRNLLHLENKRFGHWLVLEQAETGDKGHSSFWKCKCDCGNVRKIRGRQLTTGKSSQCMSCANKLPKNIKHLPKGEAAFNSLYSNYKNSAKQRDLIFNLTKDDFRKLTKQNCYYCNKKPSQICQRNFYGFYLYNGIDRLNPNKGYIKENCVSCCTLCNFLKRKMSFEDFYLHIKTIFINLSRKEIK